MNTSKIIDIRMVQLMVLSFLFPSPLNHILFLISLFVVGFKNFGFSKKQYYFKKFLFLFIVFFLLFFIQIYMNYQGREWLIRLFGLTRSIVGIEIMILFFSRYLNNYDYYPFLVLYLIIYNVIYLYSRLDGYELLPSHYGSINACCTLNALFLPLFYLSFKKRLLLSILYIVLVIILAYYANSTTFYFVLLAHFFILFIAKFKFIIPIVTRFLKKKGLLILVCFMTWLVYNILNNSDAQDVFFELISLVDMARHDIYVVAMDFYNNSSNFIKIFGNGNNEIYRAGDMSPAHNVLFEMLLVFGLIGFVFFMFETYCLVKWSYNNISKYGVNIFLILFSGYFMFFFHPFYTTFLLGKVFMILCICQIHREVIHYKIPRL